MTPNFVISTGAQRSGEIAVRQKQIPFGNDRKKSKGDAFAPVEMTNFML